MVRILLADNQPRVRFALRALLAHQPGLVIAGEVIDSVELRGQLESANPDLALLSWELPGLAAMGSLSTLRETCPGLYVIVLSGQPEAECAALAAGADDFVGKTDPPEKLLKAIQRQKQRAS